MPEYDLASLIGPTAEDLVFLPWLGKLARKKAYHWQLPPKVRAFVHPLMLLRRSMAMRALNGGGQRQAVQEMYDRKFADTYARRIPATVTHLFIWQNLLPFLQLNKALGGRTYTILAWRAPRHVLHSLLDQAQALWPDSKTLDDFRSTAAVVDAEQQAFANSQEIITPNHELVKLYPQKTRLVPWQWPDSSVTYPKGNAIVFLGPTLARRGAYLVRAAMDKLKLSFVVAGRNLEDPGFWHGHSIESVALNTNWLDHTGLLVAPALTEFRPRIVMQALTRNIPTITGPWCGLPPHPQHHIINVFDPMALAQKIAELRPAMSSI
jgi:hypothetical protein